MKSSIITKDFLYQEYTISKKSTYQIAKETGYTRSSIIYNMKKHNIKSRNLKHSAQLRKHPSKYSQILTKEFLYREYVTKEKTTTQIAQEIGCGRTLIWEYLKVNKIKPRSNSEAKQLQLKDSRNHSNWQDGKSTKKYNCIDCKRKIITYDSFNSGVKRCMKCYLKFNKGKNHPCYIEGLIREYPIKFNKILKASIRERDNHVCQICGKTTEENGRRLDVHHIDYIKANLDPENLISLCINCHRKSNYNRPIYIEFFKILKELL